MNVQSLNAIKCSFDCPALWLPWGWSGVVNFVHPLRAAHASPSQSEGEEKGVLCFALGSRVRGNDGVVRGNDGWARGNDGWARGNDGGGVNFGHPLRAAHASPSQSEGEEKGVLCSSLGSRVRGNDGVVRGNDGLTREKPGTVFNPVFWRERSWICASTEFRWRLRRSFLRIGLLPTVQCWRFARESDSARIRSRKETDAGTPAKIFRTRREIPSSTTCPSPLVKVVVTITRLDPSSRRRRSLATKRD